MNVYGHFQACISEFYFAVGQVIMKVYSYPLPDHIVLKCQLNTALSMLSPLLQSNYSLIFVLSQLILTYYSIPEKLKFVK